MTKKELLFKQVYRNTKDQIYRLCLGFMGNSADADDLFQDVLIKVWNNLDRFRSESNINTWVYRIATNTALTFLKRKNRRAVRHSQVEPDQLKIDAVEFDIQPAEDKINKLFVAISTLKEVDRIIIGLLLEECSYESIANITGLKISNVGAKINRIKKALNKKLK